MAIAKAEERHEMKPCQPRTYVFIASSSVCLALFVANTSAVPAHAELAPGPPESLLSFIEERKNISDLEMEVISTIQIRGKTNKVRRKLWLSGDRRRCDKFYTSPHLGDVRDVSVLTDDKVYFWRETPEVTGKRYAMERFESLTDSIRGELARRDKMPLDPRLLGVFPAATESIPSYTIELLTSRMTYTSPLIDKGGLLRIIATRSDGNELQIDLSPSPGFFPKRVSMISKDGLTRADLLVDSVVVIEGTTFPRSLQISQKSNGTVDFSENVAIEIQSANKPIDQDIFSVRSMNLPRGVLSVERSSERKHLKNPQTWDGERLVPRDLQSNQYRFAPKPNRSRIVFWVGATLFVVGIAALVIVFRKWRSH